MVTVRSSRLSPYTRLDENLSAAFGQKDVIISQMSAISAAGARGAEKGEHRPDAIVIGLRLVQS